ncbi:PEP-CTERM sorting domain-containing protein [Kiritimatiellota bacterium B12222]|nr:PEP-CTERM sorting domain-containing protein [Kiritimatiellota bacterium B12222]
MNPHIQTFLVTLPILSVFVSQPLQATTLVYEGFNYGDSDGAIHGQAVGGGAIGLNGSYTTKTDASGHATATYRSTGLSFTGLPTSGGALEMSVTASLDNTKEYALTHVPFTATATGDIYQSVLVNISANSISGGYGDSLIRNQDTANMQSNGNGAMSVYANKPSNDTPAVGYDSSTSNTGLGLTLDTTYILINKFTNVGDAGGGKASLWIMDNDSYSDWMSLGNGLEANLNTYADTSASRSSSNQIDFDTSRSLRISVGDFYVDYNSTSSNYNGAGELTVIYDELRYGTTLESITVIPEPSTFSLLLLSGLGFFTMLRMRRKTS